MAKLDDLLNRATAAAAKVITRDKGLGRDSEGGATVSAEAAASASASSQTSVTAT